MLFRLTNDAVDGYGLLLVGYVVLCVGVMINAQREKTLSSSIQALLCRSVCSLDYSQQARFGAKSGSAGGHFSHIRPPED